MAELMKMKALTYLVMANSPKNGITTLYTLSRARATPTMHKSQVEWQEELGIEITEAQWAICFANTRPISQNGHHRLIHYKYLHRVYYTPSRLLKYGLTDDDRCPTCRSGGAGFLHLYWECPGIREFWKKVYLVLTQMLDLPIPETPLVALLGYERDIQKAGRKLAAKGLLQAKRRIAMRCMRGPLPKLSEWCTDKAFCSTHLDNYNALIPKRCRLKDIWGPYRSYMVQNNDDVSEQDRVGVG